MKLFENFSGILISMMLIWCCQSIKTDELVALDDSIPAKIDFNFDVKPILSDRCFKCHGPDANQRKGDLRLDISGEVHKSANNESSHASYVISAGSLKKSELVLRILSEDPTYMMPPPEANLSLTDREKAILIKWIEQGAEFKTHWSFIPPSPMSIPQIEDVSMARNEIDHFILSALAKNGMRQSEEADKSVLLRRAALDLTGLPPSERVLQKYLEDQSEEAFEQAIDLLLDDDHYGERMALEWMDAARYADSHGYQDDGMRNTWPWRDWVIKAFNENLPYDTFLLWQLAGDLLPSPTEEQLLATCFNRNHPQSQEGGVVDEEYRVEYVADRTNTLGKSILGLTLECARCHDHKYDPITQKDYYSLFAYFNNNNDAGIVPYNGEASPTIILPTTAAKLQLDSLHFQIKELEEQVQDSANYIDAFRQWYKKGQTNGFTHQRETRGLVADFNFDKEVRIAKSKINLDVAEKGKKASPKNLEYTYAYYNDSKNALDAMVWGHIDDRPLMTDDARSGSALLFQGDVGVRFNRDLDFDRDQPFGVSLWIKILKEGESGPIFGKTNGDFEGYRGWLCKLNADGTLSFQLNHVWPDNCIDFQTLEPVKVNEWLHIAFSYDGSSKASGVNFYLNGRKPPYRLHTDNLKKSILHGVAKSNWSNQPFLLGMELRKSIQNLIVDDLLVYKRPLSRLEIDYLYDQKRILSTDQKDWYEYYLFSGRSKKYNEHAATLQELRKQENLLITDQPEVMVMRQKKYKRQTFILDRGAYDAPTELVNPSIPEAFINDHDTVGLDRLSLAKWVVDPSNPLTSRVAVNRLWRICFGQGLVATQEDFGAQGSLPSHPELLDYLALRFIELKWDMKAMLKEIMVSATYRQSSKGTAAMVEKDPQNHLYGRYPAHRLSAEIIRDQVLAASGLLVNQIGGPSVYPYQPDGIWEALATRNAITYKQQSGDSLYRRSLYTIWKRSSPPPAMMNFDAPDRYYCVVQRQKTSTPLQSLVLMNDPQFVEAARVLAEKMIAQPTLEDAIELACQRLLARAILPDELSNLKDLWQEAYDHFLQNKLQSEQLLNIGEHASPIAMDKNQLAAHTIVASTLINYDEFVTKR